MNSSTTGHDIANDLVWFKSTYSGSNETECVEVAVARTHVFIRDSKRRRSGAPFAVHPRVWADFVASIQDIPRP